MKPVLFYIPWLDLPVYGYGVMLGLSFVIGWYLMGYLVKWYGLDESKAYTAMILGLSFAIVGARFFHIITNLHMHWTLGRMLNLREGGLVAYGGYIFGVGAGVIYWKVKKADIWSYLDIVAPELALGLGLTRFGCFLRGCCYGVRSDSAFAISFPPGSLVEQQHSSRGWELLSSGWSVPVLPTQIFSSVTGLILFAISLFALRWAKKNREPVPMEDGTPARARYVDGWIIMGFVFLYSFYRFLLEFIRDDGGRGTVGDLSTSQFIALILMAIALFFAVYWLPRLALRRATAGTAPVVGKDSKRSKSNKKSGKKR